MGRTSANTNTEIRRGRPGRRPNSFADASAGLDDLPHVAGNEHGPGWEEHFSGAAFDPRESD